MTVTLRPATEQDIPVITGIYGHHVLTGLASFEEVAPDEAEMRRRRADILARGLPYLVAEREGRVIGYAYASIYRPRPAYRYTVEDSVYVAPDALGLGTGKRLLSGLIAETTAAGYREMVAVIGDSANSASIRLHASAGFRKVGTLEAVGFKFGRWVDSVLMQRHLRAAAGRAPGAVSDRRYRE